jgi:hypothetical protein
MPTLAHVRNIIALNQDDSLVVDPPSLYPSLPYQFNPVDSRAHANKFVHTVQASVQQRGSPAQNDKSTVRHS